MQLFSEYVSWQNFAATEFAQSEVVENHAEAKVRYEENLVMMRAPKGEVTVARASMSTMDTVERARQDLLNAYATRKMTQVILSNCERCAQLVSRELSRRIGGMSGVERRQQRWAP
jgi:hypothetical protein